MDQPPGSSIRFFTVGNGLTAMRLVLLPVLAHRVAQRGRRLGNGQRRQQEENGNRKTLHR